MSTKYTSVIEKVVFLLLLNNFYTGGRIFCLLYFTNLAYFSWINISYFFNSLGWCIFIDDDMIENSTVNIPTSK